VCVLRGISWRWLLPISRRYNSQYKNREKPET